MFRKLAFAGALALAFGPALLPDRAEAVCPYPGNTSGTDSAAQLAALNDICAGESKSVGGNRATYAVGATGYTAYATPTDLICLSGSASKTVRIENFAIRIQATASSMQTVYWTKRSTANTGGTSTSPSGVSHDSADAAASATVKVYTAAPTLGTSAGTTTVGIGTAQTLTVAPAAIGIYTQTVVGSLVQRHKPIVLRGAAESQCLNYNGAALPAGFTATYDVVWTEE